MVVAPMKGEAIILQVKSGASGKRLAQKQTKYNDNQ